jgi:transposase
MSNKKLEIMETRRILRLHNSGKSKRFISTLLGISRNTVTKYLDFFSVSGLSYDEIMRLSDKQLEEMFEPKVTENPEPLNQLWDLFPVYDKELRKPGMTKHKIWEGYIKENPDGYRRTQFCHYFNKWKKTSFPTMRMNHKAGDSMFVDYAGKKLHIVDKKTGEKTDVEVFVAIMGASQYTYMEATMSQRKEDFISCVENALYFYNGVPKGIVPDNLKSAVTKTNSYEPQLNEAFEDFADHYDTVVFPARIRKPRDKSLVEGVIKILYQRVYVPLQAQVFNKLEDLNLAILKELEKHNKTPLTNKRYSRWDLFEQMEKNLLKPLPACHYQMKEYAVGTVYRHCHVYMPKDKHYYSVPHYYIGSKVKIVYTQSNVEIYSNYDLIASHGRDRTPHAYTTVSEHLTQNQKHYLDLNPEKLLEEAEEVGTYTNQFIAKILEEGKYPAKAYRSCSGVLQLARKVGNVRVENACRRALDYGTHNYTIIKNILENNMDKFINDEENQDPLPDHKNIRGKKYYK